MTPPRSSNSGARWPR